MSRPSQRSPWDELVDRDCLFADWLTAVERLVPAVYPHDEALSRGLELELRKMRWSWGDLECYRVEDPSTPDPDAPASDFLKWIAASQPERYARLRRLVAHADQLLGRTALREITSMPLW